MANKDKSQYLIIGNSAGGIGAAEAIREKDPAGTITIVSDEPYPAYSRPLISDHLATGMPIEKMLYRPADFYNKKRIDTVLGDKVTKLDFASSTATFASGREIAWKKLLIATGGTPIFPKTEGSDLRGVFTFTRLDDAKALDLYITNFGRKMRAVVIGGGLIGISVSEALVKRKVEVTIVEMKDRVLNTILDDEGSALEAAALTHHGVEIVTGRTVAKINSFSPGATTGVTLDNSRPIPCEMVIFAIGVSPRLDLVRGTELKLNRGIVVNRQMESSIPGVYACGDVAEAYDFIWKENRVCPIWPAAYTGGKVAGYSMAGATAEYPGATPMNSMKYFGLNMVSAGVTVPPDSSYEVITSKHGHIYKRIVIKDKALVGMIFSGDVEKAGIIYNLIKDHADVSSFKQALVADDFGISSLPEELWRAKINTVPVAPFTPTASSGH